MFAAVPLFLALLCLIEPAQPAPAPAPLFLQPLTNLVRAKLGLVRDIAGLVARPVLDIKRAKLGLVRSGVDAVDNLVAAKRRFWS